MNSHLRFISLSALIWVVVATASAAVRVELVPENGMQPQVATGSDGTIHLVYLKGAPQGCDVRYVQKPAAGREWSAPITVNSVPNTAVAMGTIRGAQIALGKDNRVHVLWNGVSPRDASGRYGSAPLFCARKETKQSAFSPQRDLISGTLHLDGGASIAANAKGEVYVVWHGARPDAEKGESNRVVFVLKSGDNGASFSPLKIANEDFNGVCACCSLKAFLGPSGELFTLYRAARNVAQRDMTLLSSRDGGQTFSHQTLHPWAVGACPMSSTTMTDTGKGTRAAWETDGVIFSSMLGGGFSPQSIASGKARHPALAVNRRDETLVVWSVGTGWQRGGTLAWCILGADGKPTAQRGTAPGVPVWSFPAVFATPDNDFVILH